MRKEKWNHGKERERLRKDNRRGTMLSKWVMYSYETHHL